MKIKIIFNPATLNGLGSFINGMNIMGFGSPESFEKPMAMIFGVSASHAIQSSLGQTTVPQTVATLMQNTGVQGRIFLLP